MLVAACFVVTALLLWLAADPARLPEALREELADRRQPLLFSVASLWELVIKAGLGREGFLVQPALLRRALLDGSWQELPIAARHVFAVAHLPSLHRDPFDRLLLAPPHDRVTAGAQVVHQMGVALAQGGDRRVLGGPLSLIHI